MDLRIGDSTLSDQVVSESCNVQMERRPRESELELRAFISPRSLEDEVLLHEESGSEMEILLTLRTTCKRSHTSWRQGNEVPAYSQDMKSTRWEHKTSPPTCAKLLIFFLPEYDMQISWLQIGQDVGSRLPVVRTQQLRTTTVPNLLFLLRQFFFRSQCFIQTLIWL